MSDLIPPNPTNLNESGPLFLFSEYWFFLCCKSVYPSQAGIRTSSNILKHPKTCWPRDVKEVMPVYLIDRYISLAQNLVESLAQWLLFGPRAIIHSSMRIYCNLSICTVYNKIQLSSISRQAFKNVQSLSMTMVRCDLKKYAHNRVITES